MGANVTPTLPDKTPGGYAAEGNLQALINAVATALQGHQLIQDKGIRVLPEYAGDLYSRLSEVLNKKLSTLIVVGIEGVDSRAEGMTKCFRNVALQVLCFENVLMNQATSGSRVSALTLAELCAGYLHCHADFDPPVMMQEQKTLMLDEDRSKPEGGLICYKARLQTCGCPKYDFTD